MKIEMKREKRGGGMNYRDDAVAAIYFYYTTILFSLSLFAIL